MTIVVLVDEEAVTEVVAVMEANTNRVMQGQSVQCTGATTESVLFRLTAAPSRLPHSRTFFKAKNYEHFQSTIKTAQDGTLRCEIGFINSK
jgi:hypothetical protein